MIHVEIAGDRPITHADLDSQMINDRVDCQPAAALTQEERYAALCVPRFDRPLTVAAVVTRSDSFGKRRIEGILAKCRGKKTILQIRSTSRFLTSDNGLQP